MFRSLASVDKNTVAVDEQFTLELTLNGGGMGGGRISKLPDLSKFMILSGPNQSSSVQIVNGSVSSSVMYSYVLQPREAGKFTHRCGDYRNRRKTIFLAVDRDHCGQRLGEAEAVCGIGPIYRLECSGGRQSFSACDR